MSFYWYQTDEERQRDICNNINIVPLLDKYMECCDEEFNVKIAIAKREVYKGNPNWNYEKYKELQKTVEYASKWNDEYWRQLQFATEIILKNDYYSDDDKKDRFEVVCKAYRKWMRKNNYEKCLEYHHDVKDLVKYIFVDRTTDKHKKAVEAKANTECYRKYYMKKGDAK